MRQESTSKNQKLCQQGSKEGDGIHIGHQASPKGEDHTGTVNQGTRYKLIEFLKTKNGYRKQGDAPEDLLERELVSHLRKH